MFLETVSIVTGEERRAVLASGGWSPGVPLAIPQGTGQPTMKNRPAPEVSSAKAEDVRAGCADSAPSRVSITALLERTTSLSSSLSLTSRFDPWLPRVRPASAALGLVTPQRPHNSVDPAPRSPRAPGCLHALCWSSSGPPCPSTGLAGPQLRVPTSATQQQYFAFSHETPP